MASERGVLFCTSVPDGCVRVLRVLMGFGRAMTVGFVSGVALLQPSC